MRACVLVPLFQNSRYKFTKREFLEAVAGWEEGMVYLKRRKLTLTRERNFDMVLIFFCRFLRCEVRDCLKGIQVNHI